MTKVVLLGGGNVATHLFKAFEKAENVDLAQWYNRTLKTITPYAQQTKVTSNLNDLVEADVYIIAVSDDGISELSEALPFENRLVVHTSGSLSIHSLNQKQQRGVFYPLQSFTKDVELDFSEVPMCIEALDKSSYNTLKALGNAIGSSTYKISTEQRQTLHLAAVFVNNFSNQLYRIAHEISDAKSINFDILKPLISETAKKVQDISPYMAQTGPAKRKDKKTIKRHLKLLEDKTHKYIYQLLTHSIQKTHG